MHVAKTVQDLNVPGTFPDVLHALLTGLTDTKYQYKPKCYSAPGYHLWHCFLNDLLKKENICSHFVTKHYIYKQFDGFIPSGDSRFVFLCAESDCGFNLYVFGPNKWPNGIMIARTAGRNQFIMNQAQSALPAFQGMHSPISCKITPTEQKKQI